MTTTLTATGKVLIPKTVRQGQKLRPGDGFEVLTTVNGDIILRRVRRPGRSLRSHMRGLRGLNLAREDFPLGLPVEL
ncbi:MAG: AbrB/MazE/SpoVT family DNA-binding domain-containing protein [Verrucomicrobia bacterium]|nr:AbrB/MazE/SpoVT family DNA-binding domain-containing protein [Verrucomicrobiota bacterium]